MEYPIKKQRITSIDALRAFALFGIFLVHSSQLYNFYNSYNDFSYFTPIGLEIKEVVLLLFEGKCRTIFCILFGVSFYLILRNPNYTIIKFRWRCVILILFGILNKLLFTTDILCWYGVNGLFLSLLPIRNMYPSKILILSFALFVIGIQPFINLREFLFPNADMHLRYLCSHNLQYIINYPKLNVFHEEIHIFWSQGTATLSLFVLGFYFGKSGIINKLNIIINIKTIFAFLLLTTFSFIIYRKSGYLPSFHQMHDVIAALLYVCVFIFGYNRTGFLRFGAAYGQLGLTNYSLLNCIPIIFIVECFIPHKLSIEYLYIFSLIFFMAQAVFSLIWMKYYNYGPYEYLWRIATNLRYVKNKKASNNK